MGGGGPFWHLRSGGAFGSFGDSVLFCSIFFHHRTGVYCVPDQSQAQGWAGQMEMTRDHWPRSSQPSEEGTEVDAVSTDATAETGLGLACAMRGGD